MLSTRVQRGGRRTRCVGAPLPLLPLLLCLVAVAWICALSALSVLAADVEYPSFDGFYHNQHFPDWGTLDTPFLRLGGGALYSDATYRPLSEGRPSPRLLSEQLFDQPPSSRPLSSLRNATALMVFFGQQLFAEIHNGLLPGCPVEYFNIPVPRCDRHFDAQCTGKAEIPFQRSRYVATSGQGPSVPRAQLNQNSAWIDGGSIYGDTKTWTDQLRSRSGGRLKARDAGGRFPALNKAGLPFVNVPPPTDNPGPGLIRHPKTRSVNEFMMHGNRAGGFENPAVLALQILWFRNHNWHASRLQQQYVLGANDTAGAAYWTDERLFLEARKWNVAEYQHIAINEFVPAYLGETLPPYEGYKSTVNPGVADVFQAAAMRFGHSLVPSAFLRRDAQCNFRRTSSLFGTPGKIGLRTCNTFMRGNDILMEPAPTVDPSSPSEYGHSVRDSIDEWMMGLASQLSEREDLKMTSDLRNFVFGPVNYNRRDLAALNIQRGRDNGVPDFNTVRRAWGFEAAASFANVTNDETLQRKLAVAYGNSTKLVDLFVGGLAETDPVSGNPGPLFQRIMLDQFARTRDGDRFWYANTANGLFSATDLASIESTKFADIITRNTNVPPAALQRDVFRHRAGDPCPAPVEVGELELDECTPLAKHDFWTEASPSALPGVAMLFVSFFLLCVLALAGFALWQRKRTRNLMEEIERSFSPPTHHFDERVTAPQSVFNGSGPAALALHQQQHALAAPHGSAIALSQPQPRSARAGSADAGAVATTPSIQRFREAEKYLRATRTAQDLPAGAIEENSAIKSNALAAVGSSVSPPPVPPAATIPNDYGAVLYSPAMGTAAVFAEIQERAAASDRGGAAAAANAAASSAAPGRANVIHQGATAGWLSIRSASGEQERLYHVPLSFIHSVVVMGERRRVRDGGGLMSARSDAAAAGVSGLSSAGALASSAAHREPKSPMSVAGFHSVSAMTRLNMELRSGGEAYPAMFSPPPGRAMRTPMPSASPGASSTPAPHSAAPWPLQGVVDLFSPRPRADSGSWAEGDAADQYSPLRHRSILLRVPKRYDVWLVFPDVVQRAAFVLELQSACARVGGRQLGSATCLLVRQAVFSPALLNLDQASNMKTTRVRAAELQRFFQHLIAQSADTDNNSSEHKQVDGAVMPADSLPAEKQLEPLPPPPPPSRMADSRKSTPVNSPAAFSRRAAEAVLPYSTPRQKLATPRPSRLKPLGEGEPRAPLASSSHASRPVQPLAVEDLHVDASSPHAANGSHVAAGDVSAVPPASSGPVLTASAAQLQLQHNGGNGVLRSVSPSVAVSRAGRSVARPSRLQVLGNGSASTAATPAVVQSEPLQAAISSLQVSLDQAESLLDIEVTQEELASALELVPNHSFVRQLFNMADREGSGLCSFRGLEHILLTLSRGSHSAKLRLLFDLYDLNGSGILEVEELTSMVRESLRVTDEYDSPDREARVEAEVAEALAAMYAKAGMMPGDQIDFDAFQIMMTAQANEGGQTAAVGEAVQQAAAAGPITSSGHFLSPPPAVGVSADDSKSAEDSGALTKRSMLHRLLHHVQKSSRRRSQGRPSVVVGSSSAEPPKPRAASSGHQRGSSAGGNSWSVSAAALSGDVPPSLSPTSDRRHRRLDSHVVKTRERGAAAGSGVTGGPPSDELSLPSLHPTRRSLPMQLRTYVNAHRAHIFILVLFYLICFGIFGERFWFFCYQIEHVGIRRIVQWSVPVTRGSASVIAFTMGVLLLTMCRNLLCYLQTTRAARFIPFQAALGFHVLVAYTCAAFMLGHVCGHMFNWYQIATQPNTDTMCYLPDVAYPSSFLPSFTFWIFQTPTNMIGVVLTLWMIFFYVVAMARQYIYTFFMHVHGKLFVVCYVLAVIHGMHQLFAYPLFWLFCIGPGLLFLFDRLWSFARVNAPLPVLSAQVLPSKVLKLTIARPAHVTYSSGQFLRLASDFLRRDEWHPFSVTSAPHQEHLSVHVRAVGPWTARLFQLYHPMHLQRRPVQAVASAALPPNALSAAPLQPCSSNSAASARTPMDPLSPFSPPASTQSAAGGDGLAYPFASRTDMGAFMDKVPAGFVARASEFYLPPISVDGPFGGSHQGWSKFRTVVLIGGGIGITPFASILQDFMQQVQMERLQEKERERKYKKRMQQRRSAAAANRASESQPAGLSKKNAKGQRVPQSPDGARATPQPASLSTHSDNRPPMLLYFIWIGRSHMGYEWLIDMIREAESLDHATGRLHLQVQMYITTPPNQFDLRTAIDYAFDRHFDRVNGCSLFSGLRSSIGWGRPDFMHLFELLAARHPQEDVGLFTCGGASMLAHVQKACDHVNAFKGSHFHHHAEQFQ